MREDNAPASFPRPSTPHDSKQWAHLAEELLADYMASHQEAVATIKDEVTDPRQRAEALSKLSLAMDRTFRALDRGTPEHTPLAIAQMVLERQSDFIKQNFPDHLPAFLEILKPFGQALLTDPSWQRGPFER